MTYGEAFETVMSEASGKPLAYVRTMTKFFRAAVNPGGRWDEPMPDPDAAKLLAEARANPAAVRAWLAEGATRVDDNVRAAQRAENVRQTPAADGGAV